VEFIQFEIEFPWLSYDVTPVRLRLDKQIDGLLRELGNLFAKSIVEPQLPEEDEAVVRYSIFWRLGIGSAPRLAVYKQVSEDVAVGLEAAAVGREKKPAVRGRKR
jgi:hypothetical protein